ncbi:MAG: cobalamin biosynthesis protein P47K [Pirellulaceae bacterium]|nr:cobalamin biosynthesis protein P47K [Pirellulaceae bacterium]
MIGGFLGAGKTTILAQLARQYQQQGKHVCIVTNDQAADLVDTHLLKSYGYDVEEVAGSCFCCNFNGLTDAMSAFEKRARPDIILAEPVGSCTDLVATVALPMMDLLGEHFEITPYAVVLKPSHGLKILSGNGKGFSPKAEYIFRKQLEEADLLLINRIDELNPETVDQLERLLTEQFPNRPVIRLSAKTGENLESLTKALAGAAPKRGRMMEVDYDIYAEGEAELGWLNASIQLNAPTPLSLDKFLLDLVTDLKERLLALDVEPAHLKAIGQADGNSAVVNLVSSDTAVTLSLASDYETRQAEVVVNARVAVDPALLKQTVEAAIAAVAARYQASAHIDSVQSFRPGRPVPTHRVQ